ncbi:LPXTG cell wall anchor domain-containing protein [Microbacterium lacticum]
MSFTWPLGAEAPCDASTSGELVATGGHLPDATGWTGLGMLVLGAGFVALRRRRALVG